MSLGDLRKATANAEEVESQRHLIIWDLPFIAVKEERVETSVLS